MDKQTEPKNETLRELDEWVAQEEKREAAERAASVNPEEETLQEDAASPEKNAQPDDLFDLDAQSASEADDLPGQIRLFSGGEGGQASPDSSNFEEGEETIPFSPEEKTDRGGDDAEDEQDDVPVSPEKNLPEAEDLLELIRTRQYAAFREQVEDIPPIDVAAIFEEIPREYYTAFFRLLRKEQASETFVEMSSELQAHIINSFTDRELSDMLDELYLDDTVDIIEEMPANVVKRILRNSSREDRATINRLLSYPKDSAGTIMTTEYVRFTKDMTVERALRHIRTVAIDKETIYTCYITDADRHLIGLVTAKKLLISPLDATLDSIMEDSVIFATTTEDQEEVAKKFKKYGFIALPVVDREQRLVGIVTVDDAIDVLNEETEEDFAKMAAITPTETTYLKTSAFEIWKARIPWLLLLMISATLSSTILSRFESVLPVFLVLFVPMLMDTGGNSGSQASVTIIRGLSLGDIDFSDILRVVWKEVRVGIYCGASLGVVAFGKVMLVDRLIMGNTSITPLVALAVAFSLALTIVVAKLIGCSLPMFARRLGFDPAVMASPFITTIVDAVSLLVYFFISRTVFGFAI